MWDDADAKVFNLQAAFDQFIKEFTAIGGCNQMAKNKDQIAEA